MSPFYLENQEQYLRWRDEKLEHVATSLDDLVVEVDDPLDLSSREFGAILRRCIDNNMAIYASPTRDDPDRSIPHALARQLGLRHIDHNWLGDEDGLTSLTTNEDTDHKGYIPYSNRPIKWHTDGYYNPPERQIHGLLLHCVQSAERGGANALLDHEIAWLLLREQNPDFITALMAPDAMTIPARECNGEVVRKAETGPVFSIDPATGNLHMRYTARTRSIEWKDDAVTAAAVQALVEILESDTPYIIRGRLEPGMGLICNNVLHDRGGFEDGPQHKRLLYRARYYDRIANTDV
jgi:alpha-ketoglutarate-dependent taurine dioxygenase